MKILLLALLSVHFVSCGNPVKILSREIKKAGYIKYNSPIENAGTGTLIGGPPNSMMYVANPQTCFPDANDLGLKLRFEDKIVLPKIARRMETSGSANADLIEVLGAGANQIGVGFGFDRVQNITLDFEDVSVVYMDSVALKTYYDLFISDVCKTFLNEVGFIIQALKVGKMRFKFTDKYGGAIELSAPVLVQILNLGIDVGYSIENSYELVIDSPMYLGFQLAQLKYEDEGVALYRASTVKKNKYQFINMATFNTGNSDRVAARGMRSFKARFDAASLINIPQEAKLKDHARYKK